MRAGAFRVPRGRLAVSLLLLAPFAAALLLTGWVSDDAFITLRTVDNFVNGRGLTWNTAERVQSYTHPLWMFLLSGVYSLNRQAFFAAILPCLALSLAAVFLVTFKVAADSLNATAAALVLLLSRAFLDYSTSGLENPLTHFLLVLFFIAWLREDHSDRGMLLLAALAAAVTLNRMDALLLVLPPLGYALLAHRRLRALAAVCLGFVPLALWELFSVFYYGFPFPNTAYAKLNTAIPQSELTASGLHYFVNSAKNDPLTLLTIAAALALVFIPGRRRLAPLGAGIALYLLYIVSVGGDFMSGRFLSAPLLLSVCLLSSVRAPGGPGVRGAAIAAVLLLGVPFSWKPLTSGAAFGSDRRGLVDEEGVCDERGYWLEGASLLKALKGVAMPANGFVEAGIQARTEQWPFQILGAIGYQGYFAGPAVHIIDYHALADPLLSRLPAVRNDPLYRAFSKKMGVSGTRGWRIGHFLRAIPRGYLATAFSGRNRIEDRDLAAYYDKLSLAIRGDLLATGRLREIWRLNAGTYDHLLHPERSGAFADPVSDQGLLEEMLSVHPEYPLPWYWLGNLLLLNGKPAQAVTHLEKAIALKPGLAEARFDLGNALVALGRHAEAQVAFEQALRLRPGHTETLNNLGRAALSVGNYARAREAFAAIGSLELIRSFHLSRGLMFARQGRAAEARSDLEALEGLGSPRARELRQAVADLR